MPLRSSLFPSLRHLPSTKTAIISFMSTAEVAPLEIKIDITSDSICPFCFIGKRKLDRALEIAKKEGLNIEVKRQFHPYLLDPTLKPDSSRDKRQHYEKKFGKEKFLQIETMMKARGNEVGIDFSYHGKLSQTTDSHRLLAYAYEKGGEELQLPLVKKLFNGYFEREQDIGSVDFLSEQATAVGLFPSIDAAKSWLATDEMKAEVAEAIEKAQDRGIRGVPFFVVDKKYAISGAEDPELFVQVFKKLLDAQ